MTSAELNERWVALLEKVAPMAAGFLAAAWDEMVAKGGGRYKEHVLMMLEIAVLAGEAHEGVRPIREAAERVQAIAAEIEAAERDPLTQPESSPASETS